LEVLVACSRSKLLKSPQSANKQVFALASQTKNSGSTHSLDPHPHFFALGAEPSAMGQFEIVRHLLCVASQNMDAWEQSSLPHTQASGLVAEPSVVAQVGNSLHLFWDRSQCMPVVSAVSQLTLPHAQANGLGAEPSAVAQVGRHLF